MHLKQRNLSNMGNIFLKVTSKVTGSIKDPCCYPYLQNPMLLPLLPLKKFFNFNVLCENVTLLLSVTFRGHVTLLPFFVTNPDPKKEMVALPPLNQIQGG